MLFETGFEHAFEAGRCQRLQLTDGTGLLFEDGRDEACPARAGECALAGDQLIQHQAECEDVVLRASAFAPLDLLRRHILQRAEDGSLRR